MEKQLEKLLDAIKADFARSQRRWIKSDKSNAQRIEDSITAHCEQLGYKLGKKYIKITERNGGSAWGFIVNSSDDPKFKRAGQRQQRTRREAMSLKKTFLGSDGPVRSI